MERDQPIKYGRSRLIRSKCPTVRNYSIKECGISCNTLSHSLLLLCITTHTYCHQQRAHIVTTNIHILLPEQCQVVLIDPEHYAQIMIGISAAVSLILSHSMCLCLSLLVKEGTQYSVHKKIKLHYVMAAVLLFWWHLSDSTSRTLHLPLTRRVATLNKTVWAVSSCFRTV